MSKNKLNLEDLLSSKYAEILVTENENDGKIKSIKTGSLSLDISTGVGGIPLGRFTEIYGSEGCGKTTLALSICDNAIKDGYKVLYIDPEMGVDFDFVRSVVKNFNKDNFMLVKPKTLEQSLQFAEAGIDSDEYQVIILDSIGSMAPQKVFDDELTDQNVALLSRLMTIWVQRNAYSVRNKGVAFIGINQVRDKVGSYFGTYETPGGHAWKHILSLKIQLSKISDIEQDGNKIGINTKFVIKKNKLSSPYRSYMFPIIFGKGVDTVRDIVDFATMLGVIDRSGAYYKYNGDTLGQGMNKTIEYLQSSQETLDKIVEECYNATK